MAYDYEAIREAAQKFEDAVYELNQLTAIPGEQITKFSASYPLTQSEFFDFLDSDLSVDEWLEKNPG